MLPSSRLYKEFERLFSLEGNQMIAGTIWLLLL